MRFSPLRVSCPGSILGSTLGSTGGRSLHPVNLVLLLLALTCASCSQTHLRTNPRILQESLQLSSAQLDLIATDLVTALIQVDVLSPFNTTLQVSEPPTRFGRAVHQAIEYGGYGIQAVASDQGAHYVSYANRTIVNEGGQVSDYMIRIGDVTVRRAYDLYESVLLPTSPLYIRGAKGAESIQLNDTIFAQQGAQLSFENRVSVQTSPIAAAVTTGQTAASSASAPQHYDQQSALLWAQTLVLDKHNTPSNAVLSGYTPLQRTEIEFNRNSLYLGAGNKRAIEALVSAYNPATDLYYVIACATDKPAPSTQHAQSQRVIEELLLLGIADRSVFNKPCGGVEKTMTQFADSVIVLHYRQKR